MGDRRRSSLRKHFNGFERSFLPCLRLCLCRSCNKPTLWPDNEVPSTNQVPNYKVPTTNEVSSNQVPTNYEVPCTNKVPSNQVPSTKKLPSTNEVPPNQVPTDNTSSWRISQVTL